MSIIGVPPRRIGTPSGVVVRGRRSGDTLVKGMAQDFEDVAHLVK